LGFGNLRYDSPFSKPFQKLAIQRLDPSEKNSGFIGVSALPENFYANLKGVRCEVGFQTR
jgi:hypothetical protein